MLDIFQHGARTGGGGQEDVFVNVFDQIGQRIDIVTSRTILHEDLALIFRSC